jgi:hypothetical protein
MRFAITTDGGATPTVTLTQRAFAHQRTVAAVGEADLKGTVKNGKFSFGQSVQGTAVAVTYTGTIESRTRSKARSIRRDGEWHVHSEAVVERRPLSRRSVGGQP